MNAGGFPGGRNWGPAPQPSPVKLTLSEDAAVPVPVVHGDCRGRTRGYFGCPADPRGLRVNRIDPRGRCREAQAQDRGGYPPGGEAQAPTLTCLRAILTCSTGTASLRTIASVLIADM